MATEYISREAAIDMCDDDGDIIRIRNIPAADVRPVVHGEWIVDSIASNIFRCSVCGYDAPVEPTGGTEYKSNFCPTCGAYMRPEEAPDES